MFHKEGYKIIIVSMLIFAGVILSILYVLYRSAKPKIVELGNIPATEFYKDINRFPQAEKLPDTIIMRFDDQLYFGNASFFKESIYNLLDEYIGTPKYFILDGSNIHEIDSSGLHTLMDIDKELKYKNIQLHLCGAIGPVRDQLKKGGLLGEADKHHMQVHACVNFIQSSMHSDQIIICRPSNPMQTNIK